MAINISIDLLTTALADEWLAMYQYWVCRNLSRGAGKLDADPEFEQHMKDELEHADKIMLRLKELGGRPIADPRKWGEYSNPFEIVDTRDVNELLDATMKAEYDAIEFYKYCISQVRGKDETTHRLLRSILSDEEEHLYDLKEVFLANFEAGTAKRINLTARKRFRR